MLTHYRTAREPHTLWQGFPVLPWESYQAHQRRACKGHISKGREAEHKGVVPKEHSAVSPLPASIAAFGGHWGPIGLGRRD